MGVHSSLVRQALALAIAASLLPGLGAAPQGALAIVSTPTSTALAAPALNPKPVGRTTDMVATITPTVDGGNVGFFVNAEASARATVAVVIDGSGSHATWTMPADLAAGDYAVVAVYNGSGLFDVSQSTPVSVTVGPRPSVTAITSVSGPHDPSGAIAQKGDTITVGVEVADAAASALAPAGTVAIKVDGITKGTLTLPDASLQLNTGTWALGARSITAVFSSTNADFATSTSAAFPITISSNVVEATGLQATWTTFYPYKDGYRDTTTLRGRRAEPASVAVKVVSPTGKTVKTASVALGTGAWGVPWNGRNSIGTMLAAGRYTVKQTVTDALGAKVTFTSYVTLSAKRLYTYTKAFKKTVAQRSAGSLSAGWLGWKFTLPSATVYKKVVFAVYGKSGTPRGIFGPHDYTYCPSTTAWDYRCTWPYTTFPGSASWKSLAGSVSRNRHGTTVRMYAIGGYRTSVLYARVTVTYGVLK